MKLGEVFNEYMNNLIINDFLFEKWKWHVGENNIYWWKSLQCLFLDYLSHNNSINIQNGFMCLNNKKINFYVFKNQP